MAEGSINRNPAVTLGYFWTALVLWKIYAYVISNYKNYNSVLILSAIEPEKIINHACMIAILHTLLVTIAINLIMPRSAYF